MTRRWSPYRGSRLSLRLEAAELPETHDRRGRIPHAALLPNLHDSRLSLQRQAQQRRLPGTTRARQLQPDGKRIHLARNVQEARIATGEGQLERLGDLIRASSDQVAMAAAARNGRPVEELRAEVNAMADLYAAYSVMSMSVWADEKGLVIDQEMRFR